MRKTSGFALGLFIATLVAPVSAQHAATENNQTITIPAGSLAIAIDAIAKAYHINILYQSDTLNKATQKGLTGQWHYADALQHLLKDVPVYAEQVDATTFVLKPVSSPVADVPEELPVSQSSSPAPIDELIVTGTRQKDRTLFTSLSPVDVVNTPMAVGSVEMIDSLAAQLPGFTAFRLPLSDGRIFNRTSGLRGLNSDHTLILVNGKRRHRSAFLETSDGQPTDLTQIPMYAVERIEVLRDGASAMYGSDAIAGVINVILDQTNQSSMLMQAGQYYAGDGQTYSLNIKHGWGAPGQPGGTLTFGAYSDQPTSRAEQPADALRFQQAHPELMLADPVQRWGQPRREGLQLVFNVDYQLSPEASFYSFGTAAATRGSSDFNWRNPDTNQLYKRSSAFPDFDLREWFPAGFTPSFGQNETDLSMVMGVDTEFDDSHMDISVSAGQNEIRYFIRRTVNASLGPDSPTSFEPGTLRQQEISLDADYLSQLPSTFDISATLAAGLTLRQERYTIIAGDPASWAAGPAVLDGLPAGSNGFPGYTAAQSGTFKQTNIAAYADLTLPVREKIEAEVAVRYENFSLFSDIVRGKLSARYQLNDKIMLRATLSNGFRAPTAGQMYSERTSQALNADFNGVSTSGRLSPLSPVAGVLSRRPEVALTPLKPERSVNMSAGVGFKTEDGSSMNIDWYRIDLSDRFGTTPVYELTEAEQTELSQNRYGLNYPVDTVNFFQNLFNTRTEGIDIVGYLPFEWQSQQLVLTCAINVNVTAVTGGGLASNLAQKRLQEQGLPRTRAQLTLNWQFSHADVSLGWQYVGSWQDLTEPDADEFQTFSPVNMANLAVNWHASPNLKIRLGVENLFEQYPERALFQANRGLKFSRNSPHDTDGGFIYVRGEYVF